MFDAFFDSYAKESKQNGPQKNALHSLPAYLLLRGHVYMTSEGMRGGGIQPNLIL